MNQSVQWNVGSLLALTALLGLVKLLGKQQTGIQQRHQPVNIDEIQDGSEIRQTKHGSLIPLFPI